MAKVYPGEYSLIEIAAIANTPGFRTSVTPFGSPGLHRYVGSSVGWKGRKIPGASGMSEDEIAAALGISEKYGIITGKGVATGVKKIASTSVGIQDVTGVGIYTIVGKKVRRYRTVGKGVKTKEVTYTKTVLIPKRCAEIARSFGKTVTTIREAPNVRALAKGAYPPVIAPIPLLVPA